MKWPLDRKAEPKRTIPFFNQAYIHAKGCGGPDPTLVWQSEIQWQPVKQFLAEKNQNNPYIIGMTHVLLQVVGHALKLHPHVNRRIVRRRVYRFANCNVNLATRASRSDEVHIVKIARANELKLNQIAKQVWEMQLAFNTGQSPQFRDRQRLRRLPGWLFRGLMRGYAFVDGLFPLPTLGRIDGLRSSSVLVNDFSNLASPPMRSYKPSRAPDESKMVNVTLGPKEEKVVWQQGRALPQTVLPICVRVDHRVCDGFQLSQLVKTMLSLFADPAQMDEKIENRANPETSVQADNTKLLRRSA